MPANFPNSPTPNQQYSYAGSTWSWTGTYWQQIETSLVSGTSHVPTANVTYDLGSTNLRWRDLYLSGNSLILGGATLTATGSAIALPAGSTVGGQLVASGGDVATGGGPKITAVTVTNASYNNLDDTAVDIAGGYIKITGTGFAAGCTVLINNTPATSTIYIGPTEVRAQVPATAAGTYMLYVINADGGVAIRVNGVTFSATPSWVTASDLAGYSLGDAISIQLAATGATTFALAQGSTLPTGLTLTSGGLLSGSVTGLENDTSYSFTITATDAELQDSPRTFSITITIQLQVSRSLRFNRADTAYLTRTFAVNGDRQRWTWSGWVKRSGLGTLQNIINSVNVTPVDGFYFDTNDTIKYRSYNGTSETVQVVTTQVFRDTSSWYHIVVALDTTQATAANRLRMYVNGSEITAFSTATYPSQNFLTGINLAGTTELGSYSVTNTFNGYMTEVYFIDGQQLTPAAFAETNGTTGQYIPKRYTGTYGTNGFYLPFTDNSSVANLGRNYQPLTADPFWNRTVLLLNGTGTNNANNNTFIDSSTNNFTITRNGNTTQGTFSPFSQTGWGNYFNGSSYLSTPGFNFSTSDFTIEFFVNTSSVTAGPQPIGGYTTTGQNYTITLETGGVFKFYLSSNGSSWDIASGVVLGTATAGKWHHIVIVRSGNSIRGYFDGTGGTTITSSAAIYNNSTAFYIGAAGSAGGNLTGYFSNVRVLLGTAAYSPASSTITVPTAPFATGTANQVLLTCQANRFIDSNTATTAKIITPNGSPSVVAFSPFNPSASWSAATYGGSGYFDGSGDWLSAPANTAFDLGTGDFTIEGWFYYAENPPASYDYLWAIGGNNTNGIGLYVENKVPKIWNGSNVLTTTGSVPGFAWTHIAAVRSSGTLVVYQNGASIGSVSFTSNLTGGATAGPKLGRWDGVDPNDYFGYANGFRIVKGTAVYTGNFTPPSLAPLTNAGSTSAASYPSTTNVNTSFASSATSLLLNFTNAGIYDATSKNDLETVGNAQISTAISAKWGSGSIKFDGTGDYLQLPASDIYAFGSGDYTVEAWVYFTNIDNTTLQIIFMSGSTEGNSFYCHVDGNQISVGTSLAFISNQATTITTGQWYHIAFCRSGTTLRLFVNGTQAGSNATDTTSWTSSGYARVGANGIGTQTVFGYIQDLRITRAARYTGNFTPPTAQFAYNQGDINYNQWVPTNFSVTAGAGNDSLLDVPTNWGVDTGLGGEVRGNYATLNPINNSGGTFTNGNLDWTSPATDQRIALSSMSVSGISKWYCEFTMGSKTGIYWSVGIFGNSTAWNPRLHYRSDGARWVDSTQQAGNWSSFTQNDIIGIAFDGPTGTATFYKNGVSQGTMTVTDLTVLQYFGCTSDGSGGTMNYTANFGQRPFAYAAPSGFKALNTHNLPTPNVVKSNTAFDVLAYTGNDSQTVSGFNFSPDLVWVKSRSNGAYNHQIHDSVRGPTAGMLSTNSTAAENNLYQFTNFTSNGFTTASNNVTGVNNSGNTFAAWAWDAGTTTAVNTAGSISANVRVNSSAGFSIVSWTGTGATGTLGHGLAAVPAMIIVKSRSGADAWYVYHKSLGATARVQLNESSAQTTGTTVWNSTSPTSTVFSIGSGNPNSSSVTYISYCFAEISGFSAFGNYTGNSSTDGPFVYTGFRPAFVMIKSYSGAFDQAYASWTIHDNKRNPTNKATNPLFPNLSAAEGARGNGSSQPNVLDIDILSNGFKIRASATESNYGSYIYAAFAETPFKYARAR